MMLKIGTYGNQLALGQAEYTQAELLRVGVESTLITLEESWTEAAKALLRGDIDLMVHSMRKLSPTPPAGVVITAVSVRENPAELLLIRPESVESGKIFKITTGAVVGVTTALQKAQMLDFRPDVPLLDLPDDPAAALQQLREGACAALLLSAAEVAQLALRLDDLEVLELNPREFVPAPGQGVLAWQTHAEDLPTRRILKQLHHPEVSACTNIERKVLQLLGAGEQHPVGVFVEQDKAGNCHAFAAYQGPAGIHRARLSQSTRFGLAEALAERLK